MLGEFSALAGALTWAVNSVLIRSQSTRMSALSLNAVQYAAATLPFLLLLPISGKTTSLTQISPLVMAGLVGTALISMVGGDTAYVRSLRLIGVSKAFPISMCSYPLMSSLAAIAVFGEQLTWHFAFGASLVLVGLFAVSPRRPSSRGDASMLASTTTPDEGTPKATPAGWNRLAQAYTALRKPQTQGLLCALVAAVCWAAAVLTLKLILEEVDAFIATAIRVPVAALVLLTLASWRARRLRLDPHNLRPLAIVAGAGIIGVALGTVLFMLAIQNAGAARATILFATSPLFALALSLLFLKEAVTRRVALGTAASVAGIVLVIS